ncbi:TolB-like translocation protein [Pedobacter metabolipauper]|uniref:WD40 repeat protein n=1 Tax=Pedobacter metabolipauper TaxID=425513 RepID=A0A4R6SUG4_9SPHI|nr:hypothetical protein [Pedobacter metabolipauper]TDQ08059.1 hypothetical protein ATK78_2560 [Pedobacter metabolipauper]
MCINSSEKHAKENRLDSFDITADGKHIVFSRFFNGKIMLYKANIDGTDIKLLVDTTIDLDCKSPRFSPDGEEIVFIGYAGKSFKSSIWRVSINGDNLKQLTDTNSLKMEAIFSNDKKNIYYTLADEFKAYSPIARAAPHKFDVYSLDLHNNKIAKVTNLKAYSIYHITDVDSLTMVFNMGDKEGGIFFYGKRSGVLNRLVTKNDTLTNSTGYFDPAFIDQNHIICSSYYELVTIDLLSKYEKLILPSNGRQFTARRYNKKLNRIFFMKSDDEYTIQSINLDGTDLKEINIPFD